jgi:hypothetical protein
MEEWRVFTRRFLERASQEYFGAALDQIDGLALITDTQLRRLAALSKRLVTAQDWERAACAAKVAFTFASESLSALVPDAGLNSEFSVGTSLKRASREVDLRDTLKPVIQKIFGRIQQVGEYATIIASGVSASDLRRYQEIGVHVSQTIGAVSFLVTKPVSGEDVSWLHGFVVEALLKWQSAGLDPRVPEHLKEYCEKYLEKNEPSGAGA